MLNECYFKDTGQNTLKLDYCDYASIIIYGQSGEF
jgi:hypothetical protein